jgi:hypothetical protein
MLELILKGLWGGVTADSQIFELWWWGSDCVGLGEIKVADFG